MVDDVESRSAPTTSLALRLGLASGVIGIVAGVLVAVSRLKTLWHVFELQGYGHAMLAPFALGAIAVGIAVAEYVRSSRLRGPSLVFLSGAGAIASPFVAGFVLAAMLLLMMIAGAIQVLKDL
jgi:hypothetical protein